MIDAHHHLWDLSAREHRWLMGDQSWASDEELARLRRSFGLADLAPLAAASGVTGTVVPDPDWLARPSVLRGLSGLERCGIDTVLAGTVSQRSDLGRYGW